MKFNSIAHSSAGLSIGSSYSSLIVPAFWPDDPVGDAAVPRLNLKQTPILTNVKERPEEKLTMGKTRASVDEMTQWCKPGSRHDTDRKTRPTTVGPTKTSRYTHTSCLVPKTSPAMTFRHLLTTWVQRAHVHLFARVERNIHGGLRVRSCVHRNPASKVAAMS